SRSGVASLPAPASLHAGCLLRFWTIRNRSSPYTISGPPVVVAIGEICRLPRANRRYRHAARKPCHASAEEHHEPADAGADAAHATAAGLKRGGHGNQNRSRRCVLRLARPEFIVPR